jgi:D-alanine-D-alanine ligase-like ATP-grasp enzyme
MKTEERLSFNEIRPDEQEPYLVKAKYLLDHSYVVDRTEKELAERIYFSEGRKCTE